MLCEQVRVCLLWYADCRGVFKDDSCYRLPIEYEMRKRKGLLDKERNSTCGFETVMGDELVYRRDEWKDVICVCAGWTGREEGGHKSI